MVRSLEENLELLCVTGVEDQLQVCLHRYTHTYVNGHVALPSWQSSAVEPGTLFS